MYPPPDHDQLRQPQNYRNDHDGIQDRLDGARHRDETINHPEENTDYDQDHDNVN